MKKNHVCSYHGFATLRLAIGMSLLFIGMNVSAQNNTLEEITFNTLPGNRLQIDLRLSSPASEPLTFTINNPSRIALDLLNTQNKLIAKTLPIGLGLAQSINTAEAKGRTRVVLNLAQMVPYTTQIDGNHVYLTLETETANTSPAQVTTSGFSSINETPSLSPVQGRQINNIDFHRGDKGEGRVVITLFFLKNSLGDFFP